MKFPNKRYDIIYADPPWDYNDKRIPHGGAWAHYDCMKDEQIHCLPVPQIAETNSVLFLWCTFPMLPVGIECVKQWGFEYKTVAFTWVKMTKKAKWHFGGGAYTRANPEIVLLGKRGKGLERKDKSVRNLQIHEVRDHSEKPDEIRDEISRLYGIHTTKIELFARNNYLGWDAWGDEIL